MMKKAMAVIIAASAVLSVAGSCFADEWKETDSGMTYIDDSGKAVTGLKEIDGSKYYFNAKGIMKTGWLTAKSGKKYYFDKDGKMHTGCLRETPFSLTLSQTAKNRSVWASVYAISSSSRLSAAA